MPTARANLIASPPCPCTGTCLWWCRKPGQRCYGHTAVPGVARPGGRQSQAEAGAAKQPHPCSSNTPCGPHLRSHAQPHCADGGEYAELQCTHGSVLGALDRTVGAQTGESHVHSAAHTRCCRFGCRFCTQALLVWLIAVSASSLIEWGVASERTAQYMPLYQAGNCTLCGEFLCTHTQHLPGCMGLC